MTKRRLSYTWIIYTAAIVHRRLFGRLPTAIICCTRSSSSSSRRPSASTYCLSALQKISAFFAHIGWSRSAKNCQLSSDHSKRRDDSTQPNWFIEFCRVVGLIKSTEESCHVRVSLYTRWKVLKDSQSRLDWGEFDNESFECNHISLVSLRYLKNERFNIEMLIWRNELSEFHTIFCRERQVTRWNPTILV